MDNRLITITGPDMAGKQTQSLILREILSRSTGKSCARFEFPDYLSPIGKLIGAMLDEKPFTMDGYWHSDCGRAGEWVAYPGDRLRRGSWMGRLEKTGNEMVYHALLTADFYLAQAKITEALSRGNVICDRYADVEDMIYAPLDCVNYMRSMLDDDTSDEDIKDIITCWIEDSRQFMVKSDHVVVLNSTGHARPGETQDVNERDTEFQDQIRAAYTKHGELCNWLIIYCDKYHDDDLATSVFNVACAVCLALDLDGVDFGWDDIPASDSTQLIWDCTQEILGRREKRVA